MSRYIAFLRAINVGSRVVKMEKLRLAFEELGYSGVSTFIASGNVIFTADSTDSRLLESAIETHLRPALGFEVVTFLRTELEVADVADLRPFTGGRDSHFVGFLKDAPDLGAGRRILPLNSSVEDLCIQGREIYWRSRSTFRESKVSGGVIEKTLGMPATLRSVNTVRRLAAKLAG